MLRKVLGVVKEGLVKFFSMRFLIVLIMILCFSGVMIGRFFYLQILNADNYQEEYIEKIKDSLTLDATRGNIYDRNGKLLAYNRLTYSVVFSDIGTYRTHNQKNQAVLKFVELLQEQGETIESDVPLMLDENGKVVFTAVSEPTRKRFVRDLYGGKAAVEKLLKNKNIDVYELSAPEVYQYMIETYRVDKLTDANKQPVTLDDETTLNLLAVRYAMTASAYTRYKSIVISRNIQPATIAAITELSSYVDGLGIEDDSIRVYNDSIYFSHIIGYTGKASNEELEDLQTKDPAYEAGDIVGKTGIEALMEQELHGTKGSQQIYKDSVGRITEVIGTVDSTAGDDIYLTVDADMTIGIYHLLEQMIAGILVNYIVPYDYESDGTDEKPYIAVKNVYFQLINNNVISIDDLGREDASENEKKIYNEYSHRYRQVCNYLNEELYRSDPTPYEKLSDTYQEYMTFLYSDLLVKELKIVDTSLVNADDSTFRDWKAGKISLKEFLSYAIAHGWVDTSSFDNGDLYNSTDEAYELIINALAEEMERNSSFHKQVYKELIRSEVITGNELCMALFDQGILKEDPDSYEKLKNGNADTAFNFIVEKIRLLEITPAELALDPCSGAVVVTDVKTGEVLALVSYPSYDNNQMSGTVNPTYWNKVQNDLSTPLVCRATQTTIAPGSTFKMVSAIAGLEEGIVESDERVNCNGVFDLVKPNPTCWIGPTGHGNLTVRGALAQSCNVYFYNIGYQLSMVDGSFNAEQGLSVLSKYATMFGLDSTTGIEMNERKPTISFEEPVASAIGQGKNSYSTVQLSRYVTGLASGNLYEMTLVNRIENAAGETVYSHEPVIESKIELKDSTWRDVRSGMYGVTHYVDDTVGTVSSHLSDCVVDVAGKTGTAQENKFRSEHAQFVSYAPYEDPEISVTITIPNGYASGNCAFLATEVYNYIYDEITLEEILAQHAYSISNHEETSD